MAPIHKNRKEYQKDKSARSYREKSTVYVRHKLSLPHKILIFGSLPSVLFALFWMIETVLCRMEGRIFTLSICLEGLHAAATSAVAVLAGYLIAVLLQEYNRKDGC